MENTEQPKKRGRPRLSEEEKQRRKEERMEKQKNEIPKEPKKRGRKFKPDKLTPTERHREYRKNPEYREKHKQYCKAYNDRIRAMKEYCINNNIQL